MNKNTLLKSFKIAILFGFFPFLGFSQNLLNSGSVQGNFQLDAQYYQKDSTIGANEVSEKMLMNAFANIIYSNGNFSAGLRYESYRNPMLGFDPRYKGSGIAYRYATYKVDDFDITIGNFYEQFGSGMIFRSYEERNLGYDNAMDGIRVNFNPIQGIMLKAVIGTQRFFWDVGPGIVRGGDAEFALNDIIPSFSDCRTKLTLGGSIISKYQPSEEILFDVSKKYNLPENVAAFAGRMNISRGKINVNAEYAYKTNDPNSENSFIYRHGEALLVSASYSKKGLGIILTGKRVDNMAFKSKRTEVGNMLNINYLPTLTKQHAYSLSAIYPYATQPNGEMGIQGEIVYSIPKNTLLGGKYGVEIKLNYSRATSIEKDTSGLNIKGYEGGTKGYRSNFFEFGNELYFQDFNIEISKKINNRLKGSLSWVNLIYNEQIIEGHEAPSVYANVFIADINYKITPLKSIRTEIQHLSTKQDEGNWVMGMLEYSIAPLWFFSISDQYNYGNEIDVKKIHYYNIGVGYNKNSSRIQMSYGKQREGILCVGGVCRQVPAAYGFNLTITSSF
ncbi:MAG: DUF6029 family protein [Bacteroidales bacterium]|jgi:hypothetical protein